MIEHPHAPKGGLGDPVDWRAAEDSLRVDRTVGPVDTFAPGK